MRKIWSLKKNWKKSFGFGKKNRLRYRYWNWTWFQFPIPTPGLGCTLVYISTHTKSDCTYVLYPVHRRNTLVIGLKHENCSKLGLFYFYRYVCLFIFCGRFHKWMNKYSCWNLRLRLGHTNSWPVHNQFGLTRYVNI